MIKSRTSDMTLAIGDGESFFNKLCLFNLFLPSTIFLSQHCIVPQLAYGDLKLAWETSKIRLVSEV